MAAAFVDDVVSPELALVDPDLAARSRTALPSAVAVERSFAIGFEFVPEELLPDDAVTNRRGHVMPLLLVASLVAASIVGAGMFRAGSSPTESGSQSASGTTTVVASTHRGSLASEAPSTESDVATEAPVLVARKEASAAEPQPQALDTSSLTRTPSASTRDAVAPIVTARPTALVWDGLANASSYDIELVRDGSRIFSASSRSPQVNVPRSWTHDGAQFAVRPEDVVYVWPVVDGRRGSRPLVNGTQVFDNTLVARFTD